MALVLLCKLDNRFQADLWCQALDSQGIPHLLRSYEDSAYDGLYISQKGYGDLYVEEHLLGQARQIDQELTQTVQQGPWDQARLAARLDHTLLAAEATPQDLEDFLAQCLEYGVAAACLSPWMVPRAAAVLAGSPVKVCSVVGFPLGTQSGESKAAEARLLAEAGAQELDMVLNRGLVLGGRLEVAAEEVAVVVRAAGGAMVKVILELSQLPEELVPSLARACAAAGAAMLKTGSGFFGPASEDQVRLLRAAAPPGVGVKAAGGIRTLDQALGLLAAGADRLGTSAGAEILAEAGRRWPQDDS